MTPRVGTDLVAMGADLQKRSFKFDVHERCSRKVTKQKL
jgi:hypothetical protein